MMRRPSLENMTQSLAQDHEDNKRTARLVSPPGVISLKKPQGRDPSLRGTQAQGDGLSSAAHEPAWGRGG